MSEPAWYHAPDADVWHYIPDIGDTFTVTRVWEWRRWRLLPFPWHRRLVHVEEHSYRANAWMRRRQQQLGPFDEKSTIVRDILDGLLAEEGTERRWHGPDNAPLEFCRREDAEYVEGVGIAGTIQRVSDVTVTGRVDWDEETVQYHRDFANSLAGEPLR